MTDIDDAWLAERERIANNATSPPWWAPTNDLARRYTSSALEMLGDDWTFAADARTAVPALIAEVRRLRVTLRIILDWKAQPLTDEAFIAERERIHARVSDGLDGVVSEADCKGLSDAYDHQPALIDEIRRLRLVVLEAFDAAACAASTRLDNDPDAAHQAVRAARATIEGLLR